MSMAESIRKIHIISTVNGQTNEGMRNVATHIARAFEKSREVRYSGLRNICSIIRNCLACDVTLIFARANRLTYWLSRFAGILSRNAWIVCVQKPDADFTALVKKHPIRAGYLTILEKDLEEIRIREGYRKALFNVGINAEKFSPVDTAGQAELKRKYGIDPDRPLVIHVGHCSSGRGLEDFAAITGAERLIVASGMFENAGTVETLEKAGVKIHKGYLEHVEEIYQMADAYFFPTRSAEFVISIPLSVMEALSCGVPVIGYRDFENLSLIPAERCAVILISGPEEIGGAIREAAAKKRDRSYLTSPGTWEQTGNELLQIVSGQ